MQIVRDAGAATPWGEATWCAVPCRRRRRPSWRRSARISFTETREEGVPGCIANGIDEKTANKIYDDMIDFAKYAFNKSHAAAYAVVCLSDSLAKILLSHGVYGGPYDLGHR